MQHRFTILLSAALLLTGCIQSDTVIRVNADGSGTIVESRETTVAEVMTRDNLVVAAPDTTLEQARAILRHNKVEKLMLVGDDQRLSGLITIREHARGTAAHQTNRNLTLSEGAWAESVPNLDIRTNDVKCSHASTVGPIDEEQRFYLESRGVRPEVAERLVVLGFFDEVLTQLPAKDLVDGLHARVAAKLHMGSDEGEAS